MSTTTTTFDDQANWDRAVKADVPVHMQLFDATVTAVFDLFREQRDRINVLEAQSSEARVLDEAKTALIAELKAEVAELRAEMKAQLSAHEARTVALEQRPGMVHRGAWDASESYAIGDGVSVNGSTWVRVSLTSRFAKPGESRDWLLSAKCGRDGRDLR